MKLRNCCLLVVGVWLVLTAAAFSREVRVDFDHHANFAQFKTYSFAKVETPDPLWDDRVKDAIDRALSAKGWTRVPSGGDVSIRCGAASVAVASASLSLRLSTR